MKNNIIYSYKKIDSNEIVYIGRTNNIERRKKEHELYEPIEKGRPHYNFPLSKGIRKYGVNNYICEIIETDLTYEESLEREKYWIKYYNTYEDPNKYNLTPGGECITENKFSEEIIEEVRQLLKSNVPFKEIQDRTGVSIPHISEINTGKRRKSNLYNYPINNMTCGKKLNPKQVKEIIHLLQTTNISNQEISLKYNVSSATIQNINVGKRYKQKNIKYPIRVKCILSKNKRLSEQELQELILDLQETTISFSILANKYKISISTIYNINKGTTRKKEYLEYPLRK